jgi:S1-C subfamily serine protease
VTSSSAAADAGLAVGDVILMTDRGAVDGSQALMRALQTSRMSGRPFTPLLVRDPAGNLRWIALSSKAKT